MRKQTLTVWTLWLVALLLSLWAVGQVSIVTVTNELFAWISDPDQNRNIVVVWQELLAPRRTDLFQFSANFPPTYIPDSTVGVRAIRLNIDKQDITPLYDNTNAARPQVSADGRWLVFYATNVPNQPPNRTHILVKDLTNPNDPKSLSLRYRGWTDGDDADSNRDEPPDQRLANYDSAFPAVGGNGRFVAFLSQERDINDPNGDGNSSPAPNPGLGRWLIYLIDRDKDEDESLDEVEVKAVAAQFVPLDPLGVRLTEVRLFADQLGPRLAFSRFSEEQKRWELYVADFSNWTNPTVTLLAFSTSTPFSVPFIAGTRVAFSASGQFIVNGETYEPGIWVFDVNTKQHIIGIRTNGVSGAPVLSRDGTVLAFHSTATAYQRIGVDLNLRFFDFNNDNIPDDRNGVDDVFVFDLITRLPVWSTLLVRGIGPIAQFQPCFNPNLTSDLNPKTPTYEGIIAFQQTRFPSPSDLRVSVVRVVNMINNSVLR